MAKKDEAKAEEIAAAPFKCPRDGTTRFHKAEFGQLVGGEFVVTETTYRCVTCHNEYNADGTRAE